MIRIAEKLLVLTAAAVLLLAAPVLAEVRTGAFTLSPMLGYQGFDSELDLEDGMAYGLAVGYNASKNWALELDVRYVPTEVDMSAGPDVEVWSATANVLYHFTPEQDFVPYLVGGLGGLQYNIDGTGRDDEDFILNWGGGFKYALSRDIDFRLDLRHTVDFRTDNGGSKNTDDGDVANNLSATFGLNFQFGGTSNEPVRASR
jgi:OOP family OmpA-OmpF porin